MVAVDFYKEKIYRNDVKRNGRQDINVQLFVVYKMKLKFPVSLNTRVRYITKSFLGIFFQLELTYRVKFQMAGDLKAQKLSCK